MTASSRLGLYAAGLVAVFAAAYLVAGAVVPAGTAAAWSARATTATHDDGHSGDDEHAGDPFSTATLPGLAVEQNGYRIDDVVAPPTVGEPGVLSFRLVGPDGAGVDDYTVAHEKELHLIVVRADGAQFRHVHPEYGGDGHWSIPWRWDTGGSYRIYADFVPGSGDTPDTVTTVVLTSTLTVSGEAAAAPPVDDTVFQVNDLTVTLTGALAAGGSSAVTFTITRDGTAVTDLQPYLGAYGHLVALRDGDLAYLHVHPVGEPGDGSTPPGPQVQFQAEVPTPGDYLLYLDFQVDGAVHTAEFRVPAAAGQSSGEPAAEHHDSGH